MAAEAARRARAELTAGLAKAVAALRAELTTDADAATGVAADLALVRRAYLAQQRVMDQRIGALRDSLRAVLVGQSPALARVATLDALFQQALATRERHLMGGIPTLLEPRLRRQREAGEWAPATACAELQQVLLAELDLRLQPVDGLVQALRPTIDPSTSGLR